MLENATFSSFLELEPHIRRCRSLSLSTADTHLACLSSNPIALTTCWTLYLQRHVASIYDEIRKKCIVQYLIPFSCVTLDSMNAAFAGPGASIEDELVKMIRAGTLNARINTVDGVRCVQSSNSHSMMR